MTSSAHTARDGSEGMLSGALSWLAQRPAWAGAILATAAVAGALVVAAATGAPRPGVSDEFAYLLAADTFASGRLTNPAHPLWESFENYYLLQQPTYSSKFPPGQGLLLAVGQLLGHPIVGVWLGGAALVIALLWMLRAGLPPRWALLGTVLGALLFAVSGVWVQSYMPGTMAATGGALLYGGLRRVLRTPCPRAAALLALGVVLMALSRPYEGVLISLPAAGILLGRLIAGLRRGESGLLAKVVVPILAVLAGGATFTLLHNRAVTGDPLTLPYQAQHEQYPIIPIFAWQEAETGHEYRHWFMTKFERGQRLVLLQKFPPGFHWETFERRFDRFRTTFLPYWTWLPLLLLPFALRRDRWTLAALGILVFVWLGQMLTVPMLAHYFAPVASLLVFLLVQAVRAVERLPRPRISVPLATSAALALFAHATIATATTDNRNRWQVIERERPRIEGRLAEAGGKHVVFVRYGPKYNIHRTWVYNTADIDSQPVIWANDMSNWWNARLLDYYPERHFWLLSLGFDGEESIELTAYEPAPPGEDPGVRMGELGDALDWMIRHPDSRVRASVERTLTGGRFDSVLVPGNAEGRAFRVSSDRWTRGAGTAAVLLSNRRAEPAVPRLELAVGPPAVETPFEVTVVDAAEHRVVGFDSPGRQSVQLDVLAPGSRAVVIVQASGAWSPEGTNRVLGVKILSADLQPALGDGSDASPEALIE